MLYGGPTHSCEEISKGLLPLIPRLPQMVGQTATPLLVWLAFIHALLTVPGHSWLS